MLEPEFDSTNGTVYVLPDRIKVLRSGAAGVLANHLAGVPPRKRHFFYAIAAAAAMATALIAALRGDFGLSIVSGIFGAWMIHGLMVTRMPEGASIIMRDTIESVEVHPPQGDVAGWFVIHYRDSGILRSRTVTLPPGVTERSVEYARAVTLIREIMDNG
jgi:hypothetical protein